MHLYIYRTRMKSQKVCILRRLLHLQLVQELELVYISSYSLGVSLLMVHTNIFRAKKGKIYKRDSGSAIMWAYQNFYWRRKTWLHIQVDAMKHFRVTEITDTGSMETALPYLSMYKICQLPISAAWYWYPLTISQKKNSFHVLTSHW